MLETRTTCQPLALLACVEANIDFQGPAFAAAFAPALTIPPVAHPWKIAVGRGVVGEEVLSTAAPYL